MHASRLGMGNKVPLGTYERRSIDRCDARAAAPQRCPILVLPAQVAVENIDIGGPSMIRAAAKNHAHVLVVVDPADYAAVLDRLRSGTADAEFRRKLAWKAFQHTATYDATVAEWFWGEVGVWAAGACAEGWSLGLIGDMLPACGGSMRQELFVLRRGIPCMHAAPGPSVCAAALPAP